MQPAAISTPAPTGPDPMTVAEVAAEARVSQSTVRRALDAGELRFQRFRSKYLIPRAELARFMAGSTKG